MTFTITPNPEEQCFDVRVQSRPGQITTHHAATADVLDWFQKLIVEYDCSITLSTDLIPPATPEPRYLILSSTEDGPEAA